MRKLILPVLLTVLILSGCGQKADIAGLEDNSFNAGAVQATVAPTLKPEESDFRNLKWGMTLDEVVAAEGAGYKKTGDSTIWYYRIREEEYPADAEYEFSGGGLSGATFYIQPGYEDKNEYITAYTALIEKFTQRYGQPAASSKDWSEKNLENQPEQYAQAVLDGNLIWRTEWKAGSTALKLVLSRRGQDLCIGIKYTPAQ